MTPIGLRIDPLDVLFFRDGRPFDAGNRVVGGLPNPQTLAGALRTSLLSENGFSFEKFGSARRKKTNIHDALRAAGAHEWIITSQFRGPWPALFLKNGEVQPILSPPLTFAEGEADGYVRAAPIDNFPGWHDVDGLQPLWWSDKRKAKSKGFLVTLDGMKAILDGKDPAETEIVRSSELFGHDDRVGIGVEMHSFTVEQGAIYGIRFLVMKHKFERMTKIANDPYAGAEIGFYAEVFPGEGKPFLKSTPVPFGGEGRYVSVSQTKLAAWPQANPNATKSFWVLTMPAFFSGDRPALPSCLRNKGLKAAMTGHPVALSGWDIAVGGPLPIRFGVPAGSVYFCDQSPNLEFQSFTESPEDRQVGWGYALQGEWK